MAPDFVLDVLSLCSSRDSRIMNSEHFSLGVDLNFKLDQTRVLLGSVHHPGGRLWGRRPSRKNTVHFQGSGAHGGVNKHNFKRVCNFSRRLRISPWGPTAPHPTKYPSRYFPPVTQCYGLDCVLPKFVC